MNLTVPDRHRRHSWSPGARRIAGGLAAFATPLAIDIGGGVRASALLEFSEWLAIAGLAISVAAIVGVVLTHLRRRPGTLAKGFLLDPAGTPLKEIVFDPRCSVSITDAQAKLPDRGLSGDAEVEISGFRVKSVHAEKLHLILIFRGRSAPSHVDYATFLMASVEDRFDESLTSRESNVADRETAVGSKEVQVQEEEQRLASKDAQLTDLATSLATTDARIAERQREVQETIQAADAKMAAESAEVRAIREDVEQREARLKEERWALARDSEEIAKVRSTIETLMVGTRIE